MTVEKWRTTLQRHNPKEGRGSYLRTMATRTRKRRCRRSCSACGSELYRFERYCPRCGALNGTFDEAVFSTIALMALEDAVRRCADDPTHALEVIGIRDLREGRLESR